MEDLKPTENYPNPMPCYNCGKKVMIKFFKPAQGPCGTGQQDTYLCEEHSGYEVAIKCWQYRDYEEYDHINDEQRSKEVF